MATEDEFNLTVNENSLRELRETVDYVMGRADSALRRRHIQYPSGGGGGGNFIEGRLLTAMTPATNGLSGATTFTFVKWIKDKDLDPQTDPITLKEEVDKEDELVERTGVNRSTTLAADADAYIHLKKINGEWRPSPVEDVCVSEEED